MESSRKHVPSLCGCSHQTQGVCCQGGGGGLYQRARHGRPLLAAGEGGGIRIQSSVPRKGRLRCTPLELLAGPSPSGLHLKTLSCIWTFRENSIW